MRVLLAVLFLVQNAYSVLLEQNNTHALNKTFPDIGRCDNLVSELVIQLEADNGSKNTTQICRKVSECYETEKTESGNKLKKLYDYRWGKYDFYSSDMISCYRNILQDRYSRHYPICSSIYDLTLTDPDNKRKTLRVAKMCILNIANETCSTTAFNYLTENYEKFVEYLTLIPNNDECESINVELNRKQCLFLQGEIRNEWWLLKDYQKEYHTLLVENVRGGSNLCEKIKACSDSPCNMLKWVDEMKMCEVYDATVSYFYNCLKYDGKVHPVSMGKCSANDRECTKKALVKNCGDDVVEDFDKYYDWFNKYDVRDLRKLKIRGNFTQYKGKYDLQERFESFYEVGKCIPLVEQLVTLMSSRSPDDSKKPDMVTVFMCTLVNKCYQSIDLEEAKKLEKTYEAVCQKMASVFQSE